MNGQEKLAADFRRERCFIGRNFLTAGGIIANGNETVRDLADRYGIHPSEIVTLINGEEGKEDHSR